MAKLALVINRTSGRFVRGDTDALAEELTAHPAIDTVWEFGEDDIEARIRDADTQGFDGIAIAGGDGTIQAVACMAHRNGAKCPLLPLPLGTANMLVHRLYGHRSASEMNDRTSSMVTLPITSNQAPAEFSARIFSALSISASTPRM